MQLTLEEEVIKIEANLVGTTARVGVIAAEVSRESTQDGMHNYVDAMVESAPPPGAASSYLRTSRILGRSSLPRIGRRSLGHSNFPGMDGSFLGRSQNVPGMGDVSLDRNIGRPIILSRVHGTRSQSLTDTVKVPCALSSPPHCGSQGDGSHQQSLTQATCSLRE